MSPKRSMLKNSFPSTENCISLAPNSLLMSAPICKIPLEFLILASVFVPPSVKIKSALLLGALIVAKAASTVKPSLVTVPVTSIPELVVSNFFEPS